MARRRRAVARSAAASSPLSCRSGLRIIGGRFRGRALTRLSDPRTRPMKDRVREAVFNLIGPDVRDKYVLDLFAGSGALGLEAISRGAARATLIEQHFPTARVIEQNVATLGVAAQVAVAPRSAFFWVHKKLEEPQQPWLVFCSPPYRFYVERKEEMDELIRSLYRRAPAESVLVVEADGRLDVCGLPDAECWDVRQYPPAVIAIARKR